MKKLLILLFLSVGTLAFAKNTDYKITVKIENSKDTLLLMGNYFADKQYVLDSAFINKKGVFVFSSKEKELLPGMYFCSTSSGHHFDFVIGEGPIDFSFKTKDDNFVKYMEVSNSTDNKLFYDFTKKNFFTYTAIDSLRNLQKGSKDSVKIQEQIMDIAQKMDTFKLTFMDKYPKHLLTYIFKATQPIDVPEAPADVDSTKKREWQYRYYCDHYFDNVALDYDGMIRTPASVFYDKFNTYFDKVIYGLPVDTVIKYVDKVIEKTKPSKEMFKYAVWFLSNKYLQSSIMTYDAVYVHLIKKYYASGDAFWATPSSIEEETKRANRWEKLLIGKVAPDVATTDTNGRWISLHGIKAKNTLLIFWSPECGHCATIVPQFHDFYLKHKDEYGLEVYAINVDIEEVDKWKEFIKKHNFQWINTNGKESNMNWKDVYDVYKTPVIYLVNEKKEIIGKHLDVELLERILKDQKNSESMDTPTKK